MRVRAAVTCFLVFVLVSFLACTLLEDNGTHLAYAIERGAQELAHSPMTEIVVHYTPLTGVQQSYEVRIGPTSGQLPHRQGYLAVTGKNGGSTTYHARYVVVPRGLRIRKVNAGADIVLRKNGNTIEVVELR